MVGAVEAVAMEAVVPAMDYILDPVQMEVVMVEPIMEQDNQLLAQEGAVALAADSLVVVEDLAVVAQAEELVVMDWSRWPILAVSNLRAEL
jgi:hypothetical protein